MNAPCIAILGTCNTRLDELLYVRYRLINTHHVCVELVGVGRKPSTHPVIDITQPTILAMSVSPYKPSAPLDVSLLPRGELVKALSERAAPVIAALAATHELHGLIALSESGGFALAAGVMRRLPLGFPKLLVSTMAAGDVGPFVGEYDVAMLYSVVDIAGLNDILCPILDNAASAIAGMARAYQTRFDAEAIASESPNDERKTKRIVITIFGVTTPAITRARGLLVGYRCTPYTFHATGAGRRAMEALIEQGFFDGVLDLTTTELADELVGGVLSAGPHRLEAASRAGVPQVVSLGALDMVNFGPRASVPERFVRAGRRLHEHNSSVTLMRTTVAESEILGRIIAEKLMGAGKRAPTAGEKTEVWVPRGGVSVLDKQGQVFWDPDADDALVRALRRGLQEARDDGHKIRVVEREEDINHPAFVESMGQSLVQLMKFGAGDAQ